MGIDMNVPVIRTLSTRSLTFLVVASMVGAGAHTTSGFAIADLESARWVMAAWAIGAMVAVCGAVSYSSLVERLCADGGEYLYLSRFIHPSLGFVAGWISFFAGFTGAGAIAALAFEQYLWPTASRPPWCPSGCLALGLVLLLTWSHANGSRSGERGQNALVMVKLCVLIAFVAIGYASIIQSSAGLAATGVEDQSTILRSAAPSVFSFATTVMWVSFSYTGFNAAVYVAGQATGGARSVGRAMIIATGAVSVLYLLLNGLYVFGPDRSAIAGRADVATVAAAAIGGPSLSALIRVAIVTGLASSVSSVLMTGPRVYVQMSRDGYFPTFFGDDQFALRRTVWLQSAAIGAVVLTAGLPNLLSYLGMTLSLSSAVTVATLFYPRQNQSGAVRNAWGRLVCPLIYVLATVTTLILAAIHRPLEAIASLGTISIGLVAYVVSRRACRGRTETLDIGGP